MTKKTKRFILSLTAKQLIDKYAMRIDLDAEYQREKIWTTKQQETLLDSIVKDIDIPKIYLAEVPESKHFDYECIDGKQRMSSLMRFFKPTPDETPLTVRIGGEGGEKYTYDQLKEEHPTIARKIEDFELTFTVYRDLDEERVREIFRRLQLGIRLNSGEILNSRSGTIRDFVFKDRNDAPFFRHTKLSEKRSSRPFTLAQICLNSFSRFSTGEFVRTRLQDIEDFFDENRDLEPTDENLLRIKKVLNKMDKGFGSSAIAISSRAIAVSAYLYVEDTLRNENVESVKEFATFLIKLLTSIKDDMTLIADFEKPKNTFVLEEFQKYVLQASVEPYSIKRRHEFLKIAFEYFQAKKTKGQIISKSKK